MTAFGIDFGTTNSVLAAANGVELETIALDDPPGEWGTLGFDKVLPTVIAEAPDGGVHFGWRAKGTDGHLSAVKRLFATEDEVSVGSRRMRVEEAAGIFFRQISARGSDAGLTVDQAVVTIPANSRGVARFRTKVSAGLSGIEVLALLNEPTAAAMAYCRSISDGERVLVFDWGGGTLDVTILKSVGGVFIEEASKGIQRLGGIDLDDAFLRAVRARLPSHSALDRSDIELAKVQLSTRDHWTILPRGGGHEMTVTRGELEDAIRPLVVRVRDPIEKCLADLGEPRIDHLALVGGSSKIPMVQRYVQEMLRTEAMEGADPMTAVAEGAALAAAILTGEVTDFDFFVGTEHALGVLVNDDQGVDRFSTLIPRNTKLPASATDGYVPKFDNQEQVLIRVIEGDPELSVEHEDNVILKHWAVQLDPKPVAEAAFTITFEYDVDGILHVRTVDQATGRVMMNEELTFGAATSKEELVEIRRRIDATRAAGDPATEPTSRPEDRAQALLSDASRLTVRKARKKVYPFVDDATQAAIDDQIAALLDAKGEHEESTARDELERTLRQHAYLL